MTIIKLLPNDKVLVDGGPTSEKLTGFEVKILRALGISRHILTKESAMRYLYPNPDDSPEDTKIIDVFICKIRKKLGNSNLIETVWGKGFRFSSEVTLEIPESEGELTFMVPKEMTKKVIRISEDLIVSPEEALNKIMETGIKALING